MKTKPNISIIDYGMGNIRSVAKALEFVGARVSIDTKAKDILKADAVVFPGVGAFRDAIKYVRKNSIDKVIKDAVDSGRHFLGLCLGFQMLFDTSYEDGIHKGLGIIKGDVKLFKLKNNALKIPHMGWNNVMSSGASSDKMFKGIKKNPYFYFVHSYYCIPKNKKEISGITDYGIRFCSAVCKENIWGCQFHPEKSGANGLKLLKNFIDEVAK